MLIYHKILFCLKKQKTKQQPPLNKTVKVHSQTMSIKIGLHTVLKVYLQNFYTFIHAYMFGNLVCAYPIICLYSL